MSKPRVSDGVASPAVRLLGLGVLLAIAAASAGQQDGEQRERERPPGAPRHLFICAGDQARQSPDFLAVVNFDETSAPTAR